MTFALALLALLQNRGVEPQAATPPKAAEAQAQPGATRTNAGQQPVVQDTGDSLLIVVDEQSDPIDLLWLTKMCQQNTAYNFVYTEDVAKQLEQTKVRMLGPKKIPKSEFFNFYQNLMFIHKFTCTRVGRDATAVYLVQSSQPARGAQAGNELRSEPIYVDSDDVEKYAGQVATQVITVLHLPHTQVRSLQNSLRALGNESANAVISVGESNSVIVTGSGSQVAMYVRVLKLVDEETAKEARVAPSFEIIPIEFASGSDMAEMLDDLLEAQKRAAQAQRAAGGAGQGATAQLAGTGQESKIIVDKRTNSLIVMAMPEDMANIKQLVAQLDVDVLEPERTYHIYALENVKAEDLAKVLKDFIQDSSRVQPTGAGGRGGGEAGATSRNSSGENEVVVVPDPATNSLLIASGKTRYEEVRDMIQKLDRRQDQVLIETALVELTGNNFRDLGVEIGLADIPGVNQNGGFDLTSFGLSTLTDTNSDGVPDVRVPLAGNGITAGILDGDNFALPVLLRAVQELNDSNVLNVPSVLVNNNGSAKVESKDEVPTTTVTATGGLNGQTQQNFKDFQEAGITMQISPSISASGYLRLTINLKVSSFTGSFKAGDSIPPPRVTRLIETNVNVPNGDTMVIGGIITDTKNSTITQTPWLGDIPILGALFRRDATTTRRTTLYFFVTPHILRDKDFADLAEISYKRKLEASERIGAERLQVIDPEFARKAAGLDLGNFDVPLYKSPARGEVPAESVGLDPQKRAEMLKSDAVPPTDGKQ
jgi:general secretion pathway protein D